MSEGERRLAAIMFTDMVGYVALSQKDEESAMELLEEHRKLLRPFFHKHNGREIKTIGDAFLVEFVSALEAARCACDIQQLLRKTNSSRYANRKIELRIGIHLGDVIHSQNDVYGDAVNVASRIEPLANPGGICITQQVYDQIKNKFVFPFEGIGKRDLRNVEEPIEVYRVVLPWEDRPSHVTFEAHRIAVLPFANMSPDPSDDYFADGLTEELISSVSNIGGLSVISRTSSMKFKGGGKTVSEIGRELRVGSLLEGSVRKSDSFVRVMAQLIDVNTDRHIWSEKYDRELKNIFALQSEIAKNVADSLRVKIVSRELARIDKKPPRNAAAYSLYLKGRGLWNKREFEDVKKAVEVFEESIKEDPSFAPSYVGLSDCLLLLSGTFEVDIEANQRNARAYLDKAIGLDPSLAEAHASMGQLLRGDFDLRNAEEEYRLAIELKPSYASAHMWYHLLLLFQLKWKEALDEIEKAMELDPLSPGVNNNHAHYHLARRDFKKAAELYKGVTELAPRFPIAYWGLAWAKGKMEQFEDMKHSLVKMVDLTRDAFPRSEKYAGIITAYMTNDKEGLRRLISDIEDNLEGSFMDTREVAGFHFYLGEVDKGFEWLERSYSKKESSLLGIKFHEQFDGIRSDPRYHDLLERMGLDSETVGTKRS